MDAKTTEPTRSQQAMLGALQGREIYLGTVKAADVRRRRAAAKVARQSRRQNRGR